MVRKIPDGLNALQIASILTAHLLAICLPLWPPEILPRLSKFTVKAMRLTLGVSHPYATLFRRGISVPPPRHWLPLEELTEYLKRIIRI